MMRCYFGTGKRYPQNHHCKIEGEDIYAVASGTILGSVLSDRLISVCGLEFELHGHLDTKQIDEFAITIDQYHHAFLEILKERD